MNKKGFIELDEINPIAAGLAILAGIIAFWMTGNPFGGVVSDAEVNVNIVWRIISGLVTVIVAFLIVNKMAE